MAKLIQSGEFIGPGERATAARLEADLPGDWVIISNKQLVNPDGSSREVDFIVIGEHVVYAIDEKAYRGTIRGSDIAWVLPSGRSEKSPISKCEMNARRLVGHLGNSVPRLRQAMAGRHFVLARVVLSSIEADCRVNDPRVPTQVLRLETCADELVLVDRQQPEKASINPYRKGIIDELTVLRDRPRIPKAVGDYEVLELIETRGLRRILRARHRDGTEKLLELIEHADTAISERAASAELVALREYEALRRLAELGRAPLVDPYFTWNEGQYWVIPVHQLPGRTLRACRDAALALDPVRTAFDAFRALSDIHDEGVVHRGLSPETVVVREDGSVAFTDFSRSRLPGELSLAPALEPPAAGDP